MTVLRRSLLGSALVLPAVVPALLAGARTAIAAVPPVASQAPTFFRYRVGDLQLTAINDGVAYHGLDDFITNATVPEVKRALGDAFLPTDRFPITFTSLVINTGSKLVLIDTGNGDMAAPTSGTWLANFRAAGFEPSEVDTIIFSHFHTDHINGFRMKDGTARFPNAEIMVPEVEWAYWTSKSFNDRGSAYIAGNHHNVHRVFDPVASNVTTYAWDREIMPGITSVRAEGHTPGHTAFAIVSGGAKLLVMSDVTNNTTIFARHPDWSAFFDQDADTARATRHRMLDLAATERMQVSFYHAPFPATGHIERRGKGYELVPMLWTPQA